MNNSPDIKFVTLTETQIVDFRKRFNIPPRMPVSDRCLFYKPDAAPHIPTHTSVLSSALDKLTGGHTRMFDVTVEPRSAESPRRIVLEANDNLSQAILDANIELARRNVPQLPEL